MVIELFHDLVLVMPDKEETVSSGGIIIPDTAQHNNRKGTVIQTGIGSYDDLTGEFTPITVKKGDRVIFSDDAYYQQNIEWDNLWLMSEKEIQVLIN